MSDALKGREIIFELQTVGTIVKISAIDIASGTEIVLQGPASAGETTLKLNAIRRLEYVMKKKGLI